MMLGLAILTLDIVLYAAGAVKLGNWSITMPMVFVVVGFLLGSGGTGLLPVSPRTETMKAITEITLALLLFADASTLSLRQVNDRVESTEFTETIGTCLSLLVWVIFGATLVTLVFDGPISWRHILYAALSLTAVRMIPVALALRGVGFRRDTVALMGWFGPRGLASVVFTLMALEMFAEAGRPVDNLVIAATWTILLSVFLHGLSAVPLSGWYAKRLHSAAPPLAEMNETPELHQRHRALTVSANR